MDFKLVDKSLPRHIKTGIWASIVSAVMLIGIGIFWLVHPAAAEGSFSITPDSEAAIRFAQITAIFKAIADFLPPIFVLLAIGFRQYRLAGLFHVVTLVLVIAVDMYVWGAFVPNSCATDVLQHIPFAIPIVIAAWCFLKSTPKHS
jgi:ABC-type nickel/cobalt efflux system permease component RcnA